MSIVIRITPFDDIDVFLTKAKTSVLQQATRQSMNRALMKLRTETNKALRTQRKLKASEINKKYVDLRRAKAGPIHSMQAVLGISGAPISLIHFAKTKTPLPQKGIPIRRRKAVQVEVKPGQRKKLRRAFIARANNATQVFTKPHRTIIKKASSSLAHVAESHKIADALASSVGQFYQHEMQRNFARLLARAKR